MKKWLGIIVAMTMMLPIFSSFAETGNNEEKGIVKCYIIGHGKFLKKEHEISLEEANKIVEKVQEVSRIYEPYKDKEIKLSIEERRKIEEAFNDVLEEMKKIGLIPDNIDANCLGLLPHFGMAILNPIISIGLGCSYIPMYPGEAFIGFMLRPIFVQYFVLGYTGCINFRLIPPRLEYWDWVGTQTFMILGFAGIYIDFASIGFGFPPVQIIMGESLFTLGIDWT